MPMPFSYWDLQDDPPYSRPSHSNIKCFLECVTPTVKTHQQQKPFFGEDEAEYFSLSELWKFYIEWSSYGASVPIMLNSDENVVQYYSPSLSALLIYTTNSKSSIPLKRNADANPVLDDSIINQHGASNTKDQLGFLYCQYSETSIPYYRLPFTEKINELAPRYPRLLKFKSTDISPFSWMAVAWYPIYHIPVERNFKELSACFLTYHILSPSFDGLTSSISVDGKLKCMTSQGGNGRGVISLVPFAMATYKMFGTLWINSEASDQEQLVFYLNAATSWLKQLRFQHHDFEFFMSRGF